MSMQGYSRNTISRRKIRCILLRFARRRTDPYQDTDQQGDARSNCQGRRRQSSSDKTFPQVLADEQSRAATVDSAPDVLAAGQHRHGRAPEAPPDTSTGQCTSLRREVPTDHAAQSQPSRDTASAEWPPGSQGKRQQRRDATAKPA